MSMMNNGKPWWTPEQQAETDAHWARVRAGLHKPEAHVWKDDVGHLIDMHRAMAAASLLAAARHMQHVEQLLTVDEP